MHRAQHGSSRVSPVQRDRRLVAGIAVSVLLHGVLLSLQFGISGLDAGSGGPIRVTLAPAPPSVAPPEPLPAAPLPPLPDTPPPPLAALPPAPVPAQGLRLVDPLPKPAPPSPPRHVARKPARPRVVKRRPAVAPPLIATTLPDNPFTVAPSLPDIEPGPALEPVTVDEREPAPGETMIAARDEQRLREEEAARLAAAEEERLRREREETRVAAERDAAALRAQELARQEDDRRRVEHETAQAAQLAEQQAAERLAREQAQQQSAQQALERARLAQLAEEERRRREADASAEQQRLAQLHEREAALAREEAQRLAAQQQAAREAEQRLAQEAERRRITEAAQRQAAEEGARRVAEERARAERLGQERAEEAARRAAAEHLQAQAAPADGGGGARPGAGSGAGTVAGPGSGVGAGGSVPAGALVSRARDMLRGLNLPNVDPPPARPAFMLPNARRALADGTERDAPLRLYVNSVRQKLERNATVGDARFARGETRSDPLVSVALRSDGSIDDVTIVRSSGRPDMDEAVRRFVHLNARYAAFPPNVAARFDVIEIRRVWVFTEGLKLLEELR